MSLKCFFLRPPCEIYQKLNSECDYRFSDSSLVQSVSHYAGQGQHQQCWLYSNVLAVAAVIRVVQAVMHLSGYSAVAVIYWQGAAGHL